ncbi:MAG: type 4a pilus biogenesis protein PilO [Candidatus Omnitrophota bacterium]|nr:MAG: type 4a pilus biogenesis protein PilO [Candidatus Omnitrophota bacterium]
MINIKDNIIKNQKLILYGVIGLCVLVADFYFVIKPVFGGLIKIIPEVRARASRVNIMDIDVTNIPRYENRIKKLKQKLTGYKRKFSTKEEISPLLKNLSNTAKACGVKIESINPMESIERGKAKISGAYRKFPIFLRAISGYHSFGLFLNKLENGDTFMRVTDLKISGDTSGAANHRFDVTVVTYILGAPEEEVK